MPPGWDPRESLDGRLMKREQYLVGVQRPHARWGGRWTRHAGHTEPVLQQRQLVTPETTREEEEEGQGTQVEGEGQGQIKRRKVEEVV